MKWIRMAAAAALLTAAATACGDDEGPTAPRVARTQLGGVYALEAFTFDPHGSLPEVDMRGRLSQAQTPALVVDSTSSAFQLQTRDEETQLVTTISGTYTPTREGLILSFQSDADAHTLLLQRSPELVFDSAARALVLADADAGVQRTRLVDLVEEFADEQLPATVRGVLEVRFVKLAAVGQGE